MVLEVINNVRIKKKTLLLFCHKLGNFKSPGVFGKKVICIVLLVTIVLRIPTVRDADTHTWASVASLGNGDHIL
jgi:hypothetical protein